MMTCSLSVSSVPRHLSKQIQSRVYVFPCLYQVRNRCHVHSLSSIEFEWRPCKLCQVMCLRSQHFCHFRGKKNESVPWCLLVIMLHAATLTHNYIWLTLIRVNFTPVIRQPQLSCSYFETDKNQFWLVRHETWAARDWGELCVCHV